MCDNFMYSGIKFTQTRILPHSSHQLHFNLLPVVSGYLTLPRFQVKLIGSSSQQLLNAQAGDTKSIAALKNLVSASTAVASAKDANLVAQIADLERQFEEKFLLRLPKYIFVKVWFSFCRALLKDLTVFSLFFQPSGETRGS